MQAMQVKSEHYQQQLFNIYPNDQTLKRQSLYRTYRAVHESKCVVGERRYKGLAKRIEEKKEMVNIHKPNFSTIVLLLPVAQIT